MAFISILNCRRSLKPFPEKIKRIQLARSWDWLRSHSKPPKPTVSKPDTAQVAALADCGANVSAAAPVAGPRKIPTPMNASCNPAVLAAGLAHVHRVKQRRIINQPGGETEKNLRQHHQPELRRQQDGGEAER